MARPVKSILAMRALVIDDDCSLREVLRGLLCEVGCDAVRFASLEEVRACKALASGFDVVVLDVQRAGRLQRRLATELPRPTFVAIRNGDYETVLATTFARLEHQRGGSVTSDM